MQCSRDFWQIVRHFFKNHDYIVFAIVQCICLLGLHLENPALTLNRPTLLETLSLVMAEFQKGRANGFERLTEETFEKSLSIYCSGMKSQLPCGDDNALYRLHMVWTSKAVEFYESNSNMDIENLLVG